MKQISLQTKSFIILVLLAAAGAVVMLTLGGPDGSDKPSNQVDSVVYGDQQKSDNPDSANQAPVSKKPVPEVSTDGWKEYTDSKYEFSFRYNPAWTIKTATLKNGWYTLEIDPGPKYDNIRVYVSDKDFFAMDSLPRKEETFGNNTVVNALDLIYGIKAEGKYLTFDLGSSLSLQPQFKALVSTVKLAGN